MSSHNPDHFTEVTTSSSGLERDHPKVVTSVQRVLLPTAFL